MIKVTPLGVNGAFTKYYHNNYVFELGSRKLLVDAGTTLRYSLHEAGFEEEDITDIIITHLHSDHVGGLEEFAQRCKWMFNHIPVLWIREDMLGDLEEIVGKGLFTNHLQLQDYFNIRTFKTGFENDDIWIGEYLVSAINTDNLHCEGMKSIALDFFDPHDDMNVLFSSDIKNLYETEFHIFVGKYTKGILQDCSFVENGVHSTIEEVLNYYGSDLKDKGYAMHYQDDINIEELSNKYGIKFVERGKIYKF